MSFLDNLLGGGQERDDYQDYVRRYDQGAPYTGISDDEAMRRYQQVAPQLPPQAYQESAQEAFARMSPQERMQLGQYMQRQAQQQGYQDPAWGDPDDHYQDPGYLSQVAGRMHQQQPGMLGQLLGGGGGGGMGGLMGGGGGALDNHIAKAAVGGIAAMAVKRMMGGR